MSFCVFFFKQKTAYEMRISDWSSDVCSSDLFRLLPAASHGRSINRPPSFAPAAILRGGPEGGKPARQIAAPACAIPLASLRTPEGESSTVPSDTAQAPAVSTAPAAPLAPRKPQRHTLHGIAREDPYAWLRADNWRSEEHTSE